MVETVSCDSCAHHNVCRHADAMVALAERIIDRPVHAYPSVGAGMEPQLYRMTLDDNRKAFGVVLAQRCGHYLAKPPTSEESHQQMKDERLGSIIRDFFEKDMQGFVAAAPIGACPPLRLREYVQQWASFRKNDELARLIAGFFRGR